jgi:hypothetical protein
MDVDKTLLEWVQSRKVDLSLVMVKLSARIAYCWQDTLRKNASLILYTRHFFIHNNRWKHWDLPPLIFAESVSLERTLPSAPSEDSIWSAVSHARFSLNIL